MRLLLLPNLEKQSALSCAQKIMTALGDLHITPMLCHEMRAHFAGKTGCVFGDRQELMRDCDIVVPIGGDGTIISAAREAVVHSKPVLGVNAGRVGFLAQLEQSEIHELERLRNGFTTQRRMMLELVMSSPDGEIRRTALNDIVIRDGISEKISEVEVLSEEKLIASHRADGVIFATPTGSTAYSLSAGGPVVSPELSVVILTAICPQSAMYNSLVLPDSHRYTVRERYGIEKSGMSVSVDGEYVAPLEREGFVHIEKSPRSASFVDLGIRDFYSNFNEKLSWRR